MPSSSRKALTLDTSASYQVPLGKALSTASEAAVLSTEAEVCGATARCQVLASAPIFINSLIPPALQQSACTYWMIDSEIRVRNS